MIQLPNSELISKDFDLIVESTREDHYLPTNYEKYYYKTVLKENWKLNTDYTAVSRELYSYISENYKFCDPIIR